jgi:putative transposase
MPVKKAFKVEIDATPTQIIVLRKHAGARRFVYNWMLAQCINAREQGEKRPSTYDLVKRFRAEVKPNLEWYAEISSRTEEGAARDLDMAYKHFFRRIKQGRRGKQAGFPKFKRKRDGVGSFATFGKIRVTTESVTIQKVGRLKLKERGYIPTDIRVTSATLSTRGGRWFISCLCKVEIAPVEKSGVIGIDLGLKHAVTLNDGTIFDAPKPFARHARKMRRLQKSVSRKHMDSQRRRTAVAKLNRLHARIATIRADFIHNLTTSLVKTKQVIVIEDLNISGMVSNHHVARAISDVGFYEIRRQLEYKTAWYGGTVLVASRWYPSSKLCHRCGFKNEDLKLTAREWTCPQCGSSLDRDVNAACNLAALAANSSESLNGRGGGSSEDVLVATSQPADEASTCE